MQDKMQKAINLAKKTGDRLIVFDHPRSQSPFVIMPLEEYEKMAVGQSEVRGLTEDELLDKINRDIAVWKSENLENTNAEKPFCSSFENNRPVNYDPDEEKIFFPGRQLDFTPIGKIVQKKKWMIPAERKAGADEIIEEDRQYLEEI